MIPINIFSMVLGESKKVANVVRTITTENDHQNLLFKISIKRITNGRSDDSRLKHWRSPSNYKCENRFWILLIGTTFIIFRNDASVCA